MKKLLYIAFLLAMSVVMLPTDVFAQLDASKLARAQRNGQNPALGGMNPYNEWRAG